LGTKYFDFKFGLIAFSRISSISAHSSLPWGWRLKKEKPKTKQLLTNLTKMYIFDKDSKENRITTTSLATLTKNKRKKAT